MRKPVDKIRITTGHENINPILIKLQKHSIVMLDKKNQSTQTNKHSWLNRIEKVVNELSKESKDSLFRSLDTDYDNYASSYEEQLNWFEEIESTIFKINELKQKIEEEKNELNTLKLYSHIDFNILPNDQLKHVYVKTGYVNKKEFNLFNETVKDFNVEIEVSREVDDKIILFLWGTIDQKSQVAQVVTNELFNEIDLTNLGNTSEQYVIDLNKSYNYHLLELETTSEKKVEAVKQLDQIKLLYEKINNDILISEVVVSETKRVSYIDGWVKSSEFEQLKQILDNEKIVYELEKINPEADDIIPTAIENNKLVEPFESITNVFSVPSVNEIDPNATMAVWYWLIFGMMMADVGYGLVILLGGLFLLKIPKLGKSIKDLVKVFTYSSVAAIIGGILFGSFFGYSFDLARMLGLPFNIKVIDTIGDPLVMLILSIVVGFLHIITGLILKIINSIRQKQYYEMLSHGFSWLFILVGIGLYVLLPQISIIAISLILLGVLFIILFNGIQSKSIIGKAFGGLTGLFNVTGYLSDILSYVRILALALSSAVIALTMNTLAEMVAGSVFGIIIAIAIYIVGHVFNLIISLLSTYIHDGRLQYIEFFGRFYEGEGLLFEPFKIELNYYQTIESKN